MEMTITAKNVNQCAALVACRMSTLSGKSVVYEILDDNWMVVFACEGMTMAVSLHELFNEASLFMPGFAACIKKFSDENRQEI